MWATKHSLRGKPVGRAFHRSIFFAGKNLKGFENALARGFEAVVGYKLPAQKMSNADTVKVDGRRKGLSSARGTNGFAKLAVVRESIVNPLKHQARG